MYIHINVNIFQELVISIDQVQLREEIVSHFAFL